MPRIAHVHLISMMAMIIGFAAPSEPWLAQAATPTSRTATPAGRTSIPAKSSALPKIVSADPINFCKAVLDQGLYDKDSLGFSTSSFILNRNTICQSDYSSYSEAQSLSAAGGFDIPGTFSIDGSDAQASQKYQTAWHNYCSADFNQVQSDTSLRTISEHASAAILGAFQNCISVLGERTVRYIQPTAEGSGFTIYLEKHVNGQQNISIDGIDMVDNNTGQPLSIANCLRNNHQLTVSSLPIRSSGSNQLSVLCVKPKSHSISVKVTSSAGDVPTVTVPASPPDLPDLNQRVSSLEGLTQNLTGRIGAVETSVAKNLSNLPQTILQSMPTGSVILLSSPLAGLPNGWAECPGLNNYVRLSPTGATGGNPGPGGTLDLSTNLNQPGYTYEGGRPADPGTSRQSPGVGVKVSIPLPAWTYLGCMTKQ